MLELGLAVGLSLYMLFVLTKCFFRVDEGHVGVLITFGRAETTGKTLKTFPPGLHFKKPWQKAVVISLKE